MKFTCCLLLLTTLFNVANGQLPHQKTRYTYSDTLRGSITKFREGWDVRRYDLEVDVDVTTRALSGKNKISYVQTASLTIMQVDLQEPMMIDSVIDENSNPLTFKKHGNAWMVKLTSPGTGTLPDRSNITVYFHGTPRQALNAPWDGGVVWSKDEAGNPLVATACQGLGASVWWPCKDQQGDEPDNGMTVSITAPAGLSAISNGRLVNTFTEKDEKRTWKWEVVNPINTYNVTMNIGNYTNWKDTLQGKGGTLDLSYWVLKENEEKAKKQFTQVKPVIHCFESWMGKYPFYEDGYKLIETPFLGMEHQSGIAYGNKYKNGYLGYDHLSGTGWALKWDYIIVHESGHEWFGNSITTADLADMWVHEGFTTYTEVLYTECLSGRKAAYEYAAGLMRSHLNDKPLIASYGVNEKGSGDMYKKGASIIHIIRNMMNHDGKFRRMLLAMNEKYFHQQVTSKEIEQFIIEQTGLPLQFFFDQYLRTTRIPVLEVAIDNRRSKLRYRFVNAVKQFEMYLRVSKNAKPIHASTAWKTVTLPKKQGGIDADFIEGNYLVQVKEVKPLK